VAKRNKKKSAYEDATVANDPEIIGKKMRKIRKENGLSLLTVGARAGLSVGLISQIERGITSPSMKSLRAISLALGVSVQDFFQTVAIETEGSQTAIRPAERQVLIYKEQGVTSEILTKGGPGSVQLFIANISPGGGSGPDLDTHEGEEAGVIVSGRLDLWVGDEYFQLVEGDSFGFSSLTPHRYANPGPLVTRVHWAVSPPIY
jgi:transcriptional regulator with XRE-family HTH domain